MLGNAREIALRGVVQGVGLRPWALQQARALALGGEVRNEPWGVHVRLEGPPRQIAAWLDALRSRPPEGARIESVEIREVPPRGADRFAIRESSAAEGTAPTRIPLDRAICAACRDELFDPDDRRYRYAFTHCARCGPRAAVLRGLPYDRERTTLADFPPCPACAREYRDPEDRRFHAESIACASCGPRLRAREPNGEPASGDAVELAAARLRDGGIVAVKGYGGFHLLCDATLPGAVARLRSRKARPTKPFAILVPGVAEARRIARLGEADEAWLAGPAHAVVVAPRRDQHGEAARVAAEVAPHTRDLGIVLPIAPVHWLLLYGPGRGPATDAPRFEALVLTSANRSDEPTVHDDAGARAQLACIADLVVTHDRAVARPNDDPVVRSARGGPIPLRLSRSTAPLTLAVPACVEGAPAVLAVGGDLKAAPALTARGEVVLGEHVGDLASVESADALEERAQALCDLLRVKPELVAHDLHPDYVGTHLAARLAARLGARTVAVQHHHAHAVACLAEHRHGGPALALVLDGAGFGADGTIWGGELLQVSPGGAQRIAHLEHVALPGGDAAVREPWRMAFSWLRAAFPEGDAPRLAWHDRRSAIELAVTARALERGLLCPPTSSCGRLFDAVASLLDLGDRASHEGELATALESLADRGDAVLAGHGEVVYGLDGAPTELRDGVIPVSPIVRALALAHARGASAPALARGFHQALATQLADAAAAAARTTGLREIVLSGGCLQNRLLAALLEARLAEAGLRVLRHHQTPPNDGALAVGQAVVASSLRA